eukprot:gene30506-35528_t
MSGSRTDRNGSHRGPRGQRATEHRSERASDRLGERARDRRCEPERASRSSRRAQAAAAIRVRSDPIPYPDLDPDRPTYRPIFPTRHDTGQTNRRAIARQIPSDAIAERAMRATDRPIFRILPTDRQNDRYRRSDLPRDRLDIDRTERRASCWIPGPLGLKGATTDLQDLRNTWWSWFHQGLLIEPPDHLEANRPMEIRDRTAPRVGISGSATLAIVFIPCAVGVSNVFGHKWDPLGQAFLAPIGITSPTPKHPTQNPPLSPIRPLTERHTRYAINKEGPAIGNVPTSWCSGVVA